jgi:hypothetical protein
VASLKTVAVRLVGGAVALVAVAGVLHAPPGLRLLARLGLRCPAATISADEASALRAEGLVLLRGLRPSPARYASGLELGASDASAVLRWAAERGASCARRTRGFELLTCSRRNGAESEESIVALDPRGRVMSVDVTRGIPEPAGLTRHFRDQRARLSETLGLASEEAGDVEEVASARGGREFATALVRYRFRDYLALVQAIRLPSGLYVREQYQTL